MTSGTCTLDELKLGRFHERLLRVEDTLGRLRRPTSVTDVPGLICYLCPRPLIAPLLRNP